MEPLSGNEKFTLHGKDTNMTVLDYWTWFCSDLYDNTMRGVMAEFLVWKGGSAAYGFWQQYHRGVCRQS